MTAILGGGISGLSAAYYALENPKLGSIVLFEATNRLGGWVHTKKSPTGTLFEQGPRTIRSRGDTGKNTLKLVDDLKLSDKILSYPTNHPNLANRYIYMDKKLYSTVFTFKSLIKACPPFNSTVAKLLWKELTAPPFVTNDESIYHFIERRVGKNIADNIISPLICGICAGDAKKISVKFLIPDIFRLEQKYGSICKGMFKERNKSNIKSDYVIWTLKGGMEQLTQTLANNLHSRDVHIRLETECNELTFHSDYVELRSNGETKKFDRIISSLPAKNLATLVRKQHPELATELAAIPTVNVALVNLKYPGKILNKPAFGFLVPPKEGIPILGTIYDSCIVPQENTVFTVMMGGAWFEKYFGTNPTKEHLLSVAVEQLQTILNIQIPPIENNVSILRNCIPQYIVGHEDRINRIKNYISKRQIPLGLCGSSYDGVGLNEVIFSAKNAVSNAI